jgi:hypothetical protein
MRRFLVLTILIGAFLAAPTQLQAGLYHRDFEVLAAFDLDENGYANPGGVDSFLPLLRLAQESSKATTEKSLTLRASIRERKKKGIENLKPEEIVALTAEMLRLRSEDDAGIVREAIDLLQPRTLRPPEGFEFLTLAHQAQALFQRGDLRQAYELEYSALKDYKFPKAIDGLTPQQVKWYERLENDYYLAFFRRRKTDAETKKPSVLDGLDPLFGSTAKGKSEPVRYIGNSGEYEAGHIAEAEMKKLPPDAIAIVQQLILWNPGDSRLMWQLAELYNATGDLRAASRLFVMCADEMKYSNPELLNHRAIVMSALDAQIKIEENLRETKKRSEEEKKRQTEQEERRRFLMVAVGVAVVIVVLSYWQTREFLRRYFGRRGPASNQPNPIE